MPDFHRRFSALPLKFPRRSNRDFSLTNRDFCFSGRKLSTLLCDARAHHHNKCNQLGILDTAIAPKKWARVAETRARETKKPGRLLPSHIAASVGAAIPYRKNLCCFRMLVDCSFSKSRQRFVGILLFGQRFVEQTRGFIIAELFGPGFQRSIARDFVMLYRLRCR